jgi:tRNA pseudouridine32 synthase/23S rRNA pseudouridine746 synthase
VRRKLRSPLPPRHGLDAARLRLPDTGTWTTLRDHLVERLPRVGAERIEQMLREERIVDRDGPLGPDTPFLPGSFVWFHRDLPVEVEVPFDLPVLHRDDALLVVDKPHFLATIPRGRHVLQTALVRLRHELGLPALSPAHRLDRATAGVLMFVIRPELRGAYQTLFRDRRIRKTYAAVAPVDPALKLPRTVVDRIVKERGVIAAHAVPGPPNAQTRVELLETRGGLGRYRLTPFTGRTHQLRLHMAGLGVPILHDDIYPVLRETPDGDFSRPLQLLASTLEFTDPLTGAQRHFASRRSLQTWPV